MAVVAKQKKSKNQLRREKLKQRNGIIPKPENATQKKIETVKIISSDKKVEEARTKRKDSFTNFNVDLSELTSNPSFKGVFTTFIQPVEEDHLQNGESDTIDDNVIYSDNEGSEPELDQLMKLSEEMKIANLSRRQLRKLNKISLATLKSTAKHPELVEWYDADAPDPKLLVMIKCHKNQVPIPINWQSKRDFLSNKKGFEKPPFELPQAIIDTGILEMRDTSNLESQTLKQSAREKVQPKMGKLDLDFQKLHDAFFKNKEVPRIYKFGDLYYEGREFNEVKNVDYDKIRPGHVSGQLRKALGIKPGDEFPWIQNMRRYGPPPSYPKFKVPGLEKEYYPEGLEPEEGLGEFEELIVPIERKHWGVVKVEEEEEEDDDDDQDEEEEDDDEAEIEYGEHEDEQAKEQEESDGGVEVVSVPIESISTSAVVGAGKQVDNDGKPKKLYQVLEKGSGNSYQLPDSKKHSRDDEKDNDEEEDLEEMAIKRAKYEEEARNEKFTF